MRSVLLRSKLKCFDLGLRGTEGLTSEAESYLLSEIVNNLSKTSLSQLLDNLGQVSGDFY